MIEMLRDHRGVWRAPFEFERWAAQAARGDEEPRRSGVRTEAQPQGWCSVSKDDRSSSSPRRKRRWFESLGNIINCWKTLWPRLG